MSEPNDQTQNPKPLSPTQKRLADAIRDLIREHGYEDGLALSLTSVCFRAMVPAKVTSRQMATTAEALHDLLRQHVALTPQLRAAACPH